MYLCYIDESGTSDIPGNTTHFILTGIAIPIWYWKDCERAIGAIKRKYRLQEAEIHTGWILRPYLEQKKISGFDSLDYDNRLREVAKYRKRELFRLQKIGKKHYHQTKKNYRQTEPYVHLTIEERKVFISEIADVVSSWGFARLFAECIDKVHFDPSLRRESVDEQAFEQVVSRFERFLKNTKTDRSNYGLLIHDNNQTVARKHTELMKKFYKSGTLWTVLENIIETPLFVESQLTDMVQIADLCAYTFRRYVENNETVLFEKIFKRADRINDVAVGVRHFTDRSCECIICKSHRTDAPIP